MNFLQLVQELHRECGAAGTAPVTVEGTVTGEAKRLLNWIKTSNLEIQDMYENWKFLRCTYSQALTPTVNTLAAPTSPNAIGSGMWDYDTFFLTEAGQTVPSPLVCQEYSEVKTEIVDTTPSAPWNVDTPSIPARVHRAIVGHALIAYAEYEGAQEILTKGQRIYTEQMARLENSQLDNKKKSRFRTGGFFEVHAE